VDELDTRETSWSTKQLEDESKEAYRFEVNRDISTGVRLGASLAGGQSFYDKVEISKCPELLPFFTSLLPRLYAGCILCLALKLN